MPIRILRSCPQCNKAFYIEGWQVLDLGETPDLRSKLLHGEINLASCPNCGEVFPLDMPFIVNDPKCKRLILFAPGPSGQADPAGVQMLRNTLSFAFPRKKPYFRHPQAVSEWEELVRLVAEGADQADEDSNRDALEQDLASLCAAMPWEQKRDILHAHPELLGEEAGSLLDAWIDRARQEGAEEPEMQLVLARRFLTACREAGVDAATRELSEEMPVQIAEGGQVFMDLPMEPQELLDSERLEDLVRTEEAARQDPAKLREMIARYEDALYWPVVANDPDVRAAVCLGLGSAYWNAGGDSAVRRLRRAIECLNEALAVYTPETDPQHYAAAQNQLGLAYLDLPTGDQAENLARAIACFEEALRFRLLEVDPMDYAGTQNNIGMALTRLEDGDRVAHLTQAVIHFQEALRFFTPDAPEMHARVCNNLGTAYLGLQDADPRAIQWAIDSFQNALRVCPDDSSWPGLSASIQINLGRAYGALQGQDQAESARQAGTYYEDALRTLDPERQPREAAVAWEGLGQAVRDGAEGEKVENLQRAIGCYRNAVALLDMNVFPADRRRVAQALGDLYLEVQAWGDAVDAYREAIVAHETLYWIAATDVSRHGQLSQAHGLYSHRAYALAKMGYCKEAVVQLEAGRAQILAESLSRDRATLERLRPEDQASFAAARKEVQKLETEARDLGSSGSDPALGQRFVQVSADLGAARQALAEVVSHIHAYLPDFMAAGLDFEAISAAAAAQPLVYLIAASQGSLALVVPPGASSLGAEHALWLDTFRDEDLSHLLLTRDADGNATGGYLVGQVGGDIALLQAALDQALPIVRDRLMGPLAEHLAALGFRQATLIAGGLLGLLPLHAALDTLTVSYAPSARALQASRKASQEQAGLSPVLLGIGNPLPSPRPLPFARAELERIAALFKAGAQRPLYERQATRAETLGQLPGATHLHFACHGAFDPAEPLDSALFLSGEDRLTLRDLLDGDLDLSASRLAALSACQTGITDFQKVPDEAVGLPAGFLEAGVPGVVSTLWPVMDISTALLMIEFYRRHLTESQNPAEALQGAQLWLRGATVSKMHLADYYERMASGEESDPHTLEFMRRCRANTNWKPFEHPYFWAGFVFSGV